MAPHSVEDVADGEVHLRRPADVVVLADGEDLPALLLDDLADAIARASLTVAADGGLRHALRAGHGVDAIVGDLDSIDDGALARARRAGTEVVAHPVDKDATDLDLALTFVAQRWDAPDSPEVLVVGGHGGRTDHALANLLMLASDRHAGLRIVAWTGTDVVHVVRDTLELRGPRGARVSLLPVGGPAAGVTTTGLRFPLVEATLEPGTSLGVSNTLTAERGQVRVGAGTLLVVRSDPAGGRP